MEANLVVDLLHKFLQVLPQFRETAVAAGVDFFSLQGFQEALTLAVFPRTGRPAHAQAGTATLQPLHVIVARILRSAIGVMHQPRLRARLAAGWFPGFAPTPSRSLCASRRPAPPPKIRTHHAAGCT